MKPATEKFVNALFVVALLVGVGLLAWRGLVLARPAETPAVFSAAVAYPDAVVRSKSEHRPVFLVATADWCGPCQMYKRGALASPVVEQFVRERMIPVALDVTNESHDAATLRIESIPVTIIMRDGVEIDRREGALSEEKLLAWLRETVGE